MTVSVSVYNDLGLLRNLNYARVTIELRKIRIDRCQRVFGER